MNYIVKVEITIGENSYFDFVLADSRETERVQQAIAEALWEDPEWDADDECYWGDGDICCVVQDITEVTDAEQAVLKKFGVI
jgi:hypothetical protein